MSINYTGWDSFDSEGDIAISNQKPLWSIDIEDDKELLKWCVTDFEAKQLRMRPKIKFFREWLALYKGIHYRSQDTRTADFRNDTETSTRVPKIVVNHIYDMIETKTSRMSRYRPAIAVLPQNIEWSDKINAETVKTLVDSRWYEVDMDSILRDTQRNAFIYGMCYVSPVWNPELGHTHPYFKDLSESAILEEGGKRFIKGADGSEIEIPNREVKVGDVEFRVITPEYLYPGLAKRWSELFDVTEIEWCDLNELRSRYPSKADKINASKQHKYDYETMSESLCNNYALKMTLWVKPSHNMPKGMRIVFTEDVILKVEEFPYEHKELPFLPLTDIDIPNEIHGRSMTGFLTQLQRHYNNLASSVARNHGLASAPKWVMPKGACKINSLGNDATIVEYQGGVPPRLETFNPTGAEIFGYMDKLETLIQRLSGVHGISRGAPPPGIRAGVALQFLDEQEAERENSAVSKRNNLIKKIALHTIALMKQYYSDTDGRLIKILGADNTYKIKEFKKANFSSCYDVRIQNSSSLPDSKSGKIQAIIDLQMAFPGLFKENHLVSMLDLGTYEEFRDKATVAVKSAEYENYLFLKGDNVEEPKSYEDLLIHYNVHLKLLQERSYKEEVPSDVRQRLENHIGITEMLMWIAATKNAAFRNQVLAIPQFPIFFSLDGISSQVVSQGGYPMPPEPSTDTGVITPPPPTNNDPVGLNQ
jgi:hypothetical protein